MTHYRWRSRRLQPWLCVLVLVGAGCGGDPDDLPREQVSGKVSFDGQPITKGNIQFIPAGSVQVTQIGAMINDGSYLIERKEGPVPGVYRVMVNAPDLRSEANLAGIPGKENEAPGARQSMAPKDRIPKKYNVASTLTAEVKAAGPNKLDFDLKD
jgi:hypothetical protein